MISIIMPIRNEARYIRRSLSAVIAQDYPADCMEILIADGMSSDGTQEIIREFRSLYPNLHLINNPGKIVSTGLNTALRVAIGEIVVRMDAHCVYPQDYVRRLVSLLQKTGSKNIGGVLVAHGSKNYTQSSIREAYFSPISVGGALRSYKSDVFLREVDAVHGGCWWKDQLLSIGLFDEEMVRNQDDELSFRFRKNGGRIIQDPSIQVKYYVRDSFNKLFNQFIQYGYWKVRVIYKHPRQASFRHFVPGAYLLSLISMMLLSIFHPYFFWMLDFLLLIYTGMLIVGSGSQAFKSKLEYWPGIFWALISMHMGYGLGFIIGMIRWISEFSYLDSYFGQITR